MALDLATSAIATAPRMACSGCGRPFTSKANYDAHVARCVVTTSMQTPAPSISTPRFGQRVTLDQQAQRHRLVEEARARLAAAAAPYEPVVLSEGSSTALADGQQPARDTVDGPSVRAVGTPLQRASAPRLPARTRESNGTPRKSEREPRVATRNPHPSKGKRRTDIAERIEFIARTAGQLKAKEQAAQLGVSYALVSKHRQELARAGRIQLRRRLSDHRGWTEAEEKFLRENVGRLSFAELAAHLHRSETACLIRVKRELDLDRHVRKANRGTLNGSDVARILGQDIHFVERQMIKWGLLRAKKHPWLRTNAGNGSRARSTFQWAIERDDLVDFLIDYPWQYDRTRIEDPFFRRVADEAWNRDPLYTTTEVAPIIGVKGQHNVSSFLANTAPKFIPRSKLIVRRKGNPAATRPRSFTGMACFIPKSTIDAIKASGWVNYRTIQDDPEKLTADRAATLLYGLAERPRYITRSVLYQRARRFFEAGAIATQAIKLGARRPWIVARPADVLALKDAFFSRTTTSMRLTAARRAMIERHQPELLADPRALALALTTGQVPFVEWRREEMLAAQQLRWAATKKWALVTKHVRRLLEHIGPKTKLAGSKRIRTYHVRACSPGLVQFPLAEARRRGLEMCEHCEFEVKSGARRRGRLVELPTCSSCGITYQRGRGRPPKVPTCPTCKAHPTKRAA
jgi:hypothetical protein